MRTKARYRKLAQEIADEEMRPLRCYEMDDLLEFYVDAELSGEDAHALYPRAWAHLQTCARCRETYEQLINPDIEE